MKKTKEFHSGLTFRLVAGMMILVAVVNVMTCIIGYQAFTDSFTTEYGQTAYYAALVAGDLIDGDRIEEYIEENQGTQKGATPEYRAIWEELERLRAAQNLNALYLIALDEEDRAQFRSVFNTVNLEVYPSIWEVGFTSSAEEEYASIYDEIYTHGHNDARKYVLCPDGINGSLPLITSFVPVLDSQGKATGLMCAQRPIENLDQGRSYYIWCITVAFLFMAVLAAIAISVYLERGFGRPIRGIMKEAVRFSSEGTMGPPEAFQYHSPLGEIEELRLLQDTIQKMEADTIRTMDNLKSVTAQQERLQTELSLARNIQAQTLPNRFPPFPDRPEFDLIAGMVPAWEIGGDFYDFFLLDDDHLAMVMADVAGKGIPAALFMMSTRNLLSVHTQLGGTPAEVLTRVNQTLCRADANSMFVTVWMGILTISTGEVIAANAGHTYPVIGRCGQGFDVLKDRHGLVLGGMEMAKYRDYTFTLAPGDVLFLYTDGVTEAVNSRGELFGQDQMLRALNQRPDASVHELMEGLASDIRLFSDGGEQFDDITMLCLKMIDSSKERSISTTPTLDSMGAAADFLDSTAEQWDFSPKLIASLQVVLDEIYSNIVHYSQAEMAVIRLQKTEHDVSMLFVDNGLPFDPTSRPDPDVTLPAEARNIGGLGLFMVGKIMDSVTYRRYADKNILILKKDL